MNALALRICMLCVVAATLLAGAGESKANANPVREWRFKVFLDDKWIGYHDFRLTPQGEDSHLLEVDARFDVKFLFINAYRYRHRTTELWRQQCLHRIQANTYDNGREFEVNGVARDDRFYLETGAGQRAFTDCVMSFAYWDSAILEADRLLNAQTGEYVDVSVSLVGREQIQVRGQSRPADRYRLNSGDFDIDLWYDAETGAWLALQSTTENGRKLYYVMI